MSSVVQGGLYWALTALQISQDHCEPKVMHPNIVTKDNQLKVKETTKPEVDNKENTVPSFRRSEVANHCHGDSCWFVINNKVYDVTHFLRMHPGGDDIMLEYGGHDATTAFIDKGHSPDAVKMLKDYYIGDVAKEDWLPLAEFT